MKVTCESDFYIQRYGIEEGLKKIKELGYQNISYTLTQMSVFPDFGEWSKEKLEEQYEPLRKVLEKYGLGISYITMARSIYNHNQPTTFETRKTWCLQTMRVAAYLGCPLVVVYPTALPGGCPDLYQRSKEILWEVLSDMREESSKIGVQVAIQNAGDLYNYGNRGEELLECAETFGVSVLLDPSMAHLLRERIPCLTTTGYWDSLVRVRVGGRRTVTIIEYLQEHLIGVLLNDTERTIGNPVLPMMGVIDHREIVRQMKTCKKELCLTVIYQPIFKRFSEFLESESLVDTLGEYFYQMADLFDSVEVK